MTSNYGNILNKIKNLIIESNMHFVSGSVDTIIVWKINQFEKPYDEMFAGDLVINVSLHFENKIYELTKELLHFFSFKTPILFGKKIRKNVKSIVGISPTMVLLFHLPCVYLKM
jgi:hypothetical protein